MRRGFMRSVRVLVAGSVVAVGCAGSARAESRHGLASCPPLAAHLHSGVLPHRVYSLHTDRMNRWRPLATDGNHVLMGWEDVQRRGYMSVVHLPSTRFVPVPRSAYPRRTYLDDWRIEWPWIVGIAYTTRLPVIPADWRLWAGNVVTGKHFIIDSYQQHRHPVAGFFPHFALSDGRVAWEFSTDRPARFDTFSAQQIAVMQLHTRHRTLLTAPDTTADFGRITMSGSLIVWERTPINTTSSRQSPVDLWLADTVTSRVTQLSHNTTSKYSSLYPKLHSHSLLFEQGQSGSDGGLPYLVDVMHGTGTGHRQWWRNYHWRALGRVGLDNTQIGAGLVSWGDWQLLDVTRSQVWHLRGAPLRRWQVDEIASRTVIVERTDPNHGHIMYVAWQIPAGCSMAGS